MTDPTTTDRPRVVVIRNSPTSGPGRLTDWLTESGLDVTVIDGEQLLAGFSLDGVAGLVLLGGGFMPDADERAPWLPAERRLVEQALAEELPLLGICLGGQLLALVTDGVVTADSGQLERGSYGVDLLPAASDDPVFGPLAGHRTLRMIQNHRDSITGLPPRATLLASSEVCAVQAFRVGGRAWGLQFHPEADAARMDSWNAESLTADGFDPAAVIAGGQADAAINTEQSRTLFAAFAAVVLAGVVPDGGVPDGAVPDDSAPDDVAAESGRGR